MTKSDDELPVVELPKLRAAELRVRDYLAEGRTKLKDADLEMLCDAAVLLIELRDGLAEFAIGMGATEEGDPLPE